MASIGKFALSLASGVQETTLALANISLDFAMIRLEAPLEYQGLGTALSKRRKHEAEEGSVHATARRLGALFADDLPSIPNLGRAYGLRASEIAEDPLLNPIGDAVYGPLAEHVGADGTSIWAAATSGRGALQVHLLACLLARMWSAAEATAIWCELVSARKALLNEGLHGLEFQPSALTASRIEITRESLAEWDASARSWLRTGDKAKLLQQKQLMLIVDNIGLPIPSHSQLFESVMRVWKKAMVTIEKLVSGVAQQIDDPEVLVGLSSWHIYPDMAFLGRETTVVQQNDPLVQKGGLITVGMQNADPDKHKGISWTMPLAQLQFYGKPETLKRSIGEQSVRVSFGHLVYVAMGSIISSWKQHAVDLDSVCKFFLALWESPKISHQGGSAIFGWHELFGEQAIFYLQAKPEEKKDLRRLMNLGRRRFAAFMAPEPNLAPAYGLCSLENSLEFLSTEAQIRAVRDMANKHNLGIDLHGGFILYKSQGVHGSCTEIASVFPYQIGNGRELHRRWTFPITVESARDPVRAVQLQYMSTNSDFFELLRAEADCLFDSEGTVKHSIDLMASTGELCGLLSGSTFRNVLLPKPITSWITANQVHWGEEGWDLNLSYLENIASRYRGTIKQGLAHQMLAWKIAAKPHCYQDVEYVQLFSTNSIIVYQPKALFMGKTDVMLPLSYLTEIISSGGLDKHLLTFFNVPSLREEHFKSSRTLVKEKTIDFRQIRSQVHCLFALYKASLVYSKLPNADIDLSVASRPLNDAHWARIDGRAVVTIIRPEAFACVAMLETGYVNLDPSIFMDVIAISAGNTLYVSEMLLNDPCKPLMEHGIRCLLGNIGRPGVALLMGPRSPTLLDPSLDTWEMVNHTDFDGKIENNFKGTSLQLSLTGYEQSVNIPHTQGRRYKEVAYVEAVVSAHDCGKWVGDIDVLSLYRDNSSILSDFGSEVINAMKVETRAARALPAFCAHTESERNDHSKFENLTSIDNWPEFLDPPPNPAIIRANGNWIARLALAAAMQGREDSAVWGSGNICWKCVDIVSRSLYMETGQILVLC